MRYNVHVDSKDGTTGQFDWEQDKPVVVGDALNRAGLIYRVRSVTLAPAEDLDYDAVVHADWISTGTA